MASGSIFCLRLSAIPTPKALNTNIPDSELGSGTAAGCVRVARKACLCPLAMMPVPKICPRSLIADALFRTEKPLRELAATKLFRSYN